MAKRKPKKRGGVNDSAACLTAVFLCLMGLGIAATMDYPECTKGQCVRKPVKPQAVVSPDVAQPVVLRWEKPLVANQKPKRIRKGETFQPELTVAEVPGENWAEVLAFHAAREQEALATICEVKECYRDKAGVLRMKQEKKG